MKKNRSYYELDAKRADEAKKRENRIKKKHTRAFDKATKKLYRKRGRVYLPNWFQPGMIQQHIDELGFVVNESNGTYYISVTNV